MNPLAFMFQRKTHILGPKHGDGFRKWDFNIITNNQEQKFLLQSVMSGQVKAIARRPASFVNVLLCAQPKSASLHLHSMLSQALDLDQHEIGFNFKGGLLYYPRLLAAKFKRKNTISHCHEAPNGNLLEMASELDFKVIVLYRNLADALISRLEMLCRDQYCHELLNPAAVRAFVAASPEKQRDIIIELFCGFYLNFYTAWKNVERANTHPLLFINYEEVRDNPMGVINKVGKWANIPKRTPQGEEELRYNAMRINFNKGISGRGRQLFNGCQQNRIRAIAEMYRLQEESFLGF